MRHDLPSRNGLKIRASQSLAALFLTLGAGAASAAPPLETGVWINHTGKGAVEIRPCGQTGASAKTLCGFIVWLKEPNNKRGEPLTDGYNPDPAKRKRTICGLPVLGSLQRVSSGYDNGWVYDPEQGAQFDAAIVAGKTQLVLTGYKGVKFFSKTFSWRRAPADLPRCDQNRQAQAAPQGIVKKASVQTGAPPQIKAPRPVPAVRPAPE